MPPFLLKRSLTPGLKKFDGAFSSSLHFCSGYNSETDVMARLFIMGGDLDESFGHCRQSAQKRQHGNINE
jgi:hypothetical protein